MVQIASSSISKHRSKRRKLALIGLLVLLVTAILMYSWAGENDFDAVRLEQLTPSRVNATAAVSSSTPTIISSKDMVAQHKPAKSQSATALISTQPPKNSAVTATTPARIKGSENYPTVFPREGAVLAIQPTYGSHRTSAACHDQAIFSFARGYELQDYLPFISSLFAQDYQGDLVLGVSSDLSKELREYFQFLVKEHPGVVIYEISLSCISVKIRTHCQTVGMFRGPNGDILRDTRSHREVAQLRFEYYWAWTTLYASTTGIWLLDSRDMYFQRHPMKSTLWRNTSQSPTNTTLHVFEESSSQPIWKQKSNRRWIKKAYGEEIFMEMKYHTVICSGSTYGGQPAVEWYTRAMVHQFDITNCTVYGCDQGHHNYLIRQGKLVGSAQNQAEVHVSSVEIYKQGEGVVNTLGLLVSNVGNLTDLELWNDKLEVLNNDRATVSPIVHQFDRDDQFRTIIEARKRKLLNEWKKRKAAAS
jgi:hypothetical protein